VKGSYLVALMAAATASDWAGTKALRKDSDWVGEKVTRMDLRSGAVTDLHLAVLMAVPRGPGSAAQRASATESGWGTSTASLMDSRWVVQKGTRTGTHWAAATDSGWAPVTAFDLAAVRGRRWAVGREIWMEIHLVFLMGCYSVAR